MAVRLVALQADVTDRAAGSRSSTPSIIPEAGSQHRHQRDLRVDAAGVCRPERRLHRALHGTHVFEHVSGDEAAPIRLATRRKDIGRGSGVAQRRQRIVDEGMRDEVNHRRRERLYHAARRRRGRRESPTIGPMRAARRPDGRARRAGDRTAPGAAGPGGVAGRHRRNGGDHGCGPPCHRRRAPWPSRARASWRSAPAAEIAGRLSGPGGDRRVRAGGAAWSGQRAHPRADGPLPRPRRRPRPDGLAAAESCRPRPRR